MGLVLMCIVSCAKAENNVNRVKTADESRQDVHLNQEGTFNEFFLSLATCYSHGLANEIDKIVLVNDDGKKVIADESMIPSDFIDQYQDVFLSSVKNNDYEANEMNYALLLEWGLIENFGLDEDEIFNHSIVYEVPGGENSEKVLSGWYYKYKGKWYLWSLY